MKYFLKNLLGLEIFRSMVSWATNIFWKFVKPPTRSPRPPPPPPTYLMTLVSYIWFCKTTFLNSFCEKLLYYYIIEFCNIWRSFTSSHCKLINLLLSSCNTSSLWSLSSAILFAAFFTISSILLADNCDIISMSNSDNKWLFYVY